VTSTVAAPPVPTGFVRLAASAPLHADPGRVAAFLSRDPVAWNHEPLAHADASTLRRYAVDLRLRVGGEAAGFTTFRKGAYVDLGRPRRAAGGWELDIGWQASTAAPLFPVFSGRLLISRTELRLDGLYAPPGGAVGRIADRLLLHVAANGTARWLLDEIERAAIADGA